MRDCNKCVYSTRDGNCQKWECKGVVTVEDIKSEAIKEFAEWLEENGYKYIEHNIWEALEDYKKESRDERNDRRRTRPSD